jgi:hypothetical protein
LPEITDVIRNPHLPDPSIPPMVGRALSLGWEMLTADIVGIVLVSLVFFVIAMAAGLLASFFGSILVTPLNTGFIGWAEARRQGFPEGVGAMLKIGMKYFVDALLLGLVVMLIAAVWAVPLMIVYMITVFSFMIPGMTNPSAPPAPPSFPSFPIGIIIAVALIVVVAFVMGPPLLSLQYLGSWAIARGVPFKAALGWAWERLRKHFFGWWWAGFAISFISSIGVLACYVGMLATMPWAVLAFTELASYEGDPDQAPRI